MDSRLWQWILSHSIVINIHVALINYIHQWTVSISRHKVNLFKAFQFCWFPFFDHKPREWSNDILTCTIDLLNNWWWSEISYQETILSTNSERESSNHLYTLPDTVMTADTISASMLVSALHVYSPCISWFTLSKWRLPSSCREMRKSNITEEYHSYGEDEIDAQIGE